MAQGFAESGATVALLILPKDLAVFGACAPAPSEDPTRRLEKKKDVELIGGFLGSTLDGNGETTTW